MTDLIIESTKSTPAVFFNVEKGILRICGKSLPENAVEFYGKVDALLDKFIAEYPKSLLEITCEFEYVNTSSSKAVYNVLKKAVDKLGNNVSIHWNYEEDDEDMYEQGLDFSDALGVEFNYKLFAA